ncbi:hypothetical protein SAMN05444161_5831 [Rhizobiales bacterium GAS191]|jgi:hypothetical protein|nr:hypothetical protein SAMN05519103_05023 [Rhizobiales bacterium GAS113]SEE45927.1 hypothetical protein SAMN05444161_5831 [Rhizobiales bacterium GAS191]
MTLAFIRKSSIVAAASLSLAAGLDMAPQQALAGGFGGFGGFAGAFVGAVAGGMVGGGPRHYGRGYYPAPRQHVARPSRGSGGGAAPAPADAASTSTESSDARNTRVLSTLAPPSKVQVAVLKDVVPNAVLGSVGSTDDLNQVGAAQSKEGERDYINRIETLIERFRSQQQRSTGEGDITAHGIEVSLDNAITEAKLDTFETFLGENWSAERLRVMILDLVDAQIGPLFDGTNRGRVAMSDLDGIIKKSSRAVYGRLFETSELLAANRSSALFVQRLYQLNGDLVSGVVREGVERMLMKSSGVVAGSFDSLTRRDDNAFALRYRLQRIVFDCLSDNMAKISAAEGGMATREEIGQRVSELSSKECSAWVTSQFVGDGGKLKPQQPMPLRAVWSASGPKDDPSMYGRASGIL